MVLGIVTAVTFFKINLGIEWDILYLTYTGNSNVALLVRPIVYNLKCII